MVETMVASRQAWWRVLAAVGLSAWITTATLSTINVGLADIHASFPGHSLAAIGWVITAFGVVYAALLLPAGRLADRFGRRPVYTLGLALFGIGGFASAVSPTFALLIASRIVQGAGGAIMGPAALGLLLEVTDARERVRAITFWSACNTIGGTSGPTIGALIIDFAGWRWALLLPALASVVVWLVGRNHLPRTRGDRSAGPLDSTGVGLVTAAMALLVLGISQGGTWGWRDERTLAMFAAAAVASLFFANRTLHHAEPAIPRNLFRARSFSVGMVASIVLGVVGGSLQLVNVLFLRNAWGYSPLAAGLGVTPAPLFASIFSPLAARIGTRSGERAAALPALIVFSVTLIWYLTQIDSTPNYWYGFFPAAALSGVTVAFTYPMVSAVVVRDVDVAQLSVASAAARAASQIGQAVGVAIVLTIIGGATGLLSPYQDAWRFLLVANTAAALAVCAIGPRPSRL